MKIVAQKCWMKQKHVIRKPLPKQKFDDFDCSTQIRSPICSPNRVRAQIFLPWLTITDGARRTVTKQQNISEVVSTCSHSRWRKNESKSLRLWPLTIRPYKLFFIPTIDLSKVWTRLTPVIAKSKMAFATIRQTPSFPRGRTTFEGLC